MSRSILVIAGEVSGDMHAAELVRALRARDPELEFFGIGGDALRAEKVELLYDVREMAVMGFAEVIRRYGFFRAVFRDMLELVKIRRPHAVLLVDYPGFNLRFAKAVRKLGIKVIYYVCPQVWAWHRSRIKLMAEIVNRLIVIFPFEVGVFAGTDLRVDFAGHPLVDVAKAELASPLKELPWQGEPRVALLPGSRRQEIERILPPMVSAAVHLQAKFPGASFILAAPSAEIASLAESVLNAQPAKPERCSIVTGETRQVLRQARAAMVASGTATIETALMGCPMVVVYRTSALTYFFGRMVVKVKHIGMVNIVAGRRVCPEYIQHEATAEALAAGMEPLLGDTAERSAMVEGLERVRLLLGQGGASERAAGFVLDAMGPASKMVLPTEGFC